MASITQLEYIVAVKQEGHFGNAARRCHVTQPTLSMQIQKLEEEYDIIIFDREKQPVRATGMGLVFIAQAQRILQEYKLLGEITRDQRQDLSGPFSLAIIPTVAPYLLPRFLKEFTHQCPSISLTIEEMQTEQLIEALEEERVDAGILATPLAVTGLSESPLYYEPFLVCYPVDHAFAKRKSIAEDELDPNEILLLEEGHCLRNQVTQICSIRTQANSSLKQQLKFAGGNLETLKRLVAGGVGFTLMPSLAIDDSFAEDIAVLKLKGTQPVREISLVVRRSQLKRPVLEQLRTCITENIPRSMRSKPHTGQILNIS